MSLVIWENHSYIDSFIHNYMLGLIMGLLLYYKGVNKDYRKLITLVLKYLTIYSWLCLQNAKTRYQSGRYKIKLNLLECWILFSEIKIFFLNETKKYYAGHHRIVKFYSKCTKITINSLIYTFNAKTFIIKFS